MPKLNRIFFVYLVRIQCQLKTVNNDHNFFKPQSFRAWASPKGPENTLTNLGPEAGPWTTHPR